MAINDTLLQAQRETLENFQNMAMSAFSGFERMVQLNLQAVKASTTESGEHLSNLLAARDVKSATELMTSGMQPVADKASAYGQHVSVILKETGMEIAKVWEKQFAETSKQWQSAVEAMVEKAPAGSSGAITLMRSAFDKANSTIEQMTAAGKQVAEFAEASANGLARSNGRTARPTA